MDDFRAVYVDPFGSIEGRSDDELFEDDRTSLLAAVPDFTVDREQALLLFGTRSGILTGLRRIGNRHVTIVSGTAHISVRKGASELEKYGRTALGAVKGAGAVVSKPVRYVIRATPRATTKFGPLGPIKVVADVFSTSPNPWRGASYDMARRIRDERSKLSDAAVQVSCAASNVHAGPSRNAFAAAARPQAGSPSPLSNSTLLLAVLADRLETDYGF